MNGKEVAYHAQTLYQSQNGKKVCACETREGGDAATNDHLLRRQMATLEQLVCETREGGDAATNDHFSFAGKWPNIGTIGVHLAGGIINGTKKIVSYTRIRTQPNRFAKQGSGTFL